MAGVGGYQRPENPAMFSGPGALSQRTDGQPSVDNPTQAAQYISGMPYGEGSALNDIQSAAPLAGNGGAFVDNGPTPIPLGTSTMFPEQPVTAGISRGPGPGPEVLSIAPTDPGLIQDKQNLAMMTGLLGRFADSPNSSYATRQLLRQMRSML
jgi:hypothetical protein